MTLLSSRNFFLFLISFSFAIHFAFAGPSKCETKVTTFNNIIGTVEADSANLESQAAAVAAQLQSEADIVNFKGFKSSLMTLQTTVNKLVEKKNILGNNVITFKNDCICKRMDKSGNKTYGKDATVKSDDECIKKVCDTKFGNPFDGDQCLFGNDIIYTYKITNNKTSATK